MLGNTVEKKRWLKTSVLFLIHVNFVMGPGNSLVQLYSICWLSDAHSLQYLSTKTKKRAFETLVLAMKCFQLDI